MADHDDDMPYTEYVPRPTAAEFKIAPRFFIYCTNSKCPMVGTGGARCHAAGNNRPEFCKHCLCKFPKKPNGESHGYKHYELLLAGPPSSPPQGPAHGKGKGKGKGDRIAFNSQPYTSPWRKEAENRKFENFQIGRAHV